jgi:hemerythrin-like domain-containing protein
MATNERPTEEFRKEHEHLMTHVEGLRRTMDQLKGGLSEESLAGLKEADWFFQVALKPHAKWEEENLYPVANDIIREYGKPSATMEVDHVDLVSRMDSFRQLLEVAQSGKATAEEVDRLRVLGYQIEAILLLHFRKEEDVYLDAMDRHARPEVVAKLMEAARHAHSH